MLVMVKFLPTKLTKYTRSLLSQTQEATFMYRKKNVNHIVHANIHKPYTCKSRGTCSIRALYHGDESKNFWVMQLIVACVFSDSLNILQSVLCYCYKNRRNSFFFKKDQREVGTNGFIPTVDKKEAVEILSNPPGGVGVNSRGSRPH